MLNDHKWDTTSVCQHSHKEIARELNRLEDEITWHKAELSRLWKAMNATSRSTGRLVYTEAWAEARKLNFAILVSDDIEGEEEAAHRIRSLILAVWPAAHPTAKAKGGA